MHDRFRRAGCLRFRSRSILTMIPAGLLMLASSNAAASGAGIELQRFQHETRLPDGGRVVLHNAWGDIRVKTTGDVLVRFNAVMQKIGDTPHAGTFRHHIEDGNLVLRLDYPADDRPESPRNGRIDAALLVPHDTPVTLHADRGRILTGTLDAPLKVHATDGDIEVRTHSGVDIRARGGDVRLVLRPGGKNEIGRVATRTGDIEIQYADDLPLALDIRTGSSITTNDAALLESRKRVGHRTGMRHAGTAGHLRIDSDNGRVILVNRSRLSRQ